MRILREWIRRLWGTLRRGRSTADLEQELRTHLELAAEDARRRGLGPEQAIRTAQIETGGAAQISAGCRGSMTWRAICVTGCERSAAVPPSRQCRS